MAKETIRLRGYRETMQALNKVEKGMAKTVRDRLKQAAEPVVAATRAEVSQYPGASVSTIGPRASSKGVFVTQRAKKVTGAHPEFGRLQMNIMEQALEDRQDEVLDEVEDALDDLGRSAGF